MCVNVQGSDVRSVRDVKGDLGYNHDGITIRKTIISDVPYILDIQHLVYHNQMNENANVFISFIREPRNKCYTILDEYDIIGYFIAHPYSIYKLPPKLHCDSPFFFEGEQMRDWYIHDMALYPSYHKKGLGTVLYKYFLKTIPTNSSLSLVAVNGADLFWEKHGFYAQLIDTKGVLTTYTSDAKFMICNR